MKVLLDIKDDKAAFILELLNQFKYVKTNPLTPFKAEVFEDLKEAVDEVNRIKSGKENAIPLNDFLNDL